MHNSKQRSGFNKLVCRRAEFIMACSGALFLTSQVGYSAAILLKEGLILNGNSFLADSYDSTDPAKSTDGHYDVAKAGDSGDVICKMGISYPSQISGGNIYGHVYRGTGSDVNLGTNGAVGTHAWQMTNSSGLEPGFVLTYANVTIPDTSLPDYSGYVAPPPGDVVIPSLVGTNIVYSTNHYDHVLAGGNYYSAIALSGNTIVTGSSTLVMPNGFSMSGFDTIDIQPSGSLKIYAGGTNCVIDGKGFINESGLPGNLVVYCTTEVTNLTLNGNGEFAGVLIAPNVDAVLNGGGHSDQDISGALIAKSLILHGNFKFHFDEALLQLGIVPPNPSLAASLTVPQMSGTGQFQFNVDGVSDRNYGIEVSTNLSDWHPVFTNFPPFTFIDTNGSGASQSFYRAKSSP